MRIIDNNNFYKDLKKESLKVRYYKCSAIKTVLPVLEKNAPKNEIYTFKQLQFYDKRTEKAIMNRSKLRSS